MNKSNNFFLLVIVSLMSLMGFASLDIIFPSLPTMSKIFHTSISTIQLSVSSYLLGYGVSQLIYGPLSDQYGRKPMIMIGTSIYLLGGLICLYSSHINILIVGRLIQGLGVGACALLARVILRDCFEGVHMAKNTSYVSAVIIAGVSLAPVIGGIIQILYNYRGVFLFMITYGVVFLIIVYKLLPETNQKKNTNLNIRCVFKSYKNIIKTKDFLAYTSFMGIALTSTILFSLYNPFFIQDTLGYSPAHYGMLIVIISLGEFIGAFANSWFVERYGINKMIIIGFISIGIASLLLVILNFNSISLIGLLLPSTFVAVGTGLIFANAISGAYSTFNENIGAVGSVFGFFQIILTVIMGYVISMFDFMTPNFLALMLIILCFFGTTTLYLTCKGCNLHA